MADSDDAEDVRRRLRVAQLSLARRLQDDELGCHSRDDRPLDQGILGAHELLGAGDLETAAREVARIELLARHVEELNDSRPDVMNALRPRLLTSNVGNYYGARYEAVIAAALVRNKVPFQHEGFEAPDFVVQHAGVEVGIECTSGRLNATELVDPFYKIDAALAGKAAKRYASPRVALAIDVTNLFARSLAAGGNLMADGLEARMAMALNATAFGAIIATVQAIDDAVRPRRFSTYPRRIESSKIDPALRDFLAAVFPIQPMRVPLAWIPHEP